MKLDEFKRIREALGEDEAMILKFGATWCKPCKLIKPLVEGLVERLPPKVRFYVIDIDESVELYLAFKSKKMVRGVPTMLGFLGDSESEGLIPDELVSGSDEEGICAFFETMCGDS